MSRPSPADIVRQDVSTRDLETVRVGESAGKINSGIRNAFVGYESGMESTRGSYDTFVGYQAGKASATASFSTFIGAYAGAQNIRGGETVGIGYKTMEQSKDANQSTAVGAYALRENISGTGSVAVGYRAGERMLDGRYNTLLGTEVAQNMRTGDFNTIQGYQAGRAAFAIDQNAYFGAFAGYSNNSGTGNCFLGYKSGYALEQGSYNVAIGAFSMYSGSNINSNVAIGPFAGGSGDGDGSSSASATESVILGSFAASKGSPSKSVVIGTGAAQNTKDTSSVLIGYQTCPTVTDGSCNIMIGVGADGLFSNTYNSIAIGSSNTIVSTESISIGNSIKNARYRSLLMGFSLDADADNTVMMGYENTLESVILFKDSLSYSFTTNTLLDGQSKFNLCNINYTDTLVSPDGSNFYETARGWVYGNILSNSESQQLVQIATPSAYDLTAVTKSFALVQGGFLAVGISEEIVTPSNVITLFPPGFQSKLSPSITSNSSLFYTPPLSNIVTHIQNSYSLYDHDRSFTIDFTQSNTNLPTVNILNFNASNATVPIHIIKRVAPAYCTNANISISNIDAITSINIGNMLSCNVTFSSNGITLDTCNISYVITTPPLIGQLGEISYTPSNWAYDLTYTLTPERLYTRDSDTFSVTPILNIDNVDYIADTPAQFTINLLPPSPSPPPPSPSPITSNITWLEDYPPLTEQTTFSTSNILLSAYSNIWNFPPITSNIYIENYPQSGILLNQINSITYISYNPYAQSDSFSFIAQNSNGETVQLERSITLDDSTRVGTIDVLTFTPCNVTTYFSNIESSPQLSSSPVKLLDTLFSETLELTEQSNFPDPNTSFTYTSNIITSNISMSIDGYSNIYYSAGTYRLDDGTSNVEVAYDPISIQTYTMSNAISTSNFDTIVETFNSNGQYNIVRRYSIIQSLTYTPAYTPSVTTETTSNLVRSYYRRPIVDATCNIYSSNGNITYEPIPGVGPGTSTIGYSNIFAERIANVAVSSTNNYDTTFVFGSNQNTSNFYDHLTQSYIYTSITASTQSTLIKTVSVPCSAPFQYTYNSNILTKTTINCYRSYAPVTENVIFTKTPRTYTTSAVNTTVVMSNVGPCTSCTTDDIENGRLFVIGNLPSSSFTVRFSDISVPGRSIECKAPFKLLNGTDRTLQVNSSNQLGQLDDLESVQVGSFVPEYIHFYKTSPSITVSKSTMAMTTRLSMTDTPLVLATGRFPSQEIWYFYSQNGFTQASSMYKVKLNLDQNPFPSSADFNTSPINSNLQLQYPSFYHSRNGASSIINVDNDSTNIFGTTSFTMPDTLYFNTGVNANPIAFNYSISNESWSYPLRTYSYDGYLLPEQCQGTSIQCSSIGTNTATTTNVLQGPLWNNRNPNDYTLLLEPPLIGLLNGNTSIQLSAFSNIRYIPLTNNTSNTIIRARLIHNQSLALSPAYDITLKNYLSVFPATSNIASASYTIPISDGLITDGYYWQIEGNTSKLLMRNNPSDILFDGIWPQTDIMSSVSFPVQVTSTSISITVDQADCVDLSILSSCVQTKNNNNVTFYIAQNPNYGIMSMYKFNLEDLPTVFYRHIGKNVFNDIFYVAVSSSPYTLSDVAIAVRVNVNKVPIIYSSTSIKRINLASSNDALNTIIPITSSDIVSSGDGQIRVLTSNNVTFVNSTGTELSFKINSNVLTTVPYSPMSFQYYASSSSNANGSNQLMNYPTYSNLFIHDLNMSLNQHISILEPYNPITPIQRIDYNINPDILSVLRTDRTVAFTFQVNPSWDLNIDQLDNYKTFKFSILFQTTDNLEFEILKTPETTIWTVYISGIVSETGILESQLIVGSWNKIVITNNYEDTANIYKFKIEVQQQTVYKAPYRDFSGLQSISILVPVTDPLNFKFTSASNIVSTVPNGDLEYSFVVQNFRSILEFKDAQISATTYTRGEFKYDSTTHNIVIGKTISVKGSGNLCLGTDFSTTGNYNIILGNSVGKTNDSNTNNEIYQSIIIGSSNFTNSTVSDVICIGNENLSGLEYNDSLFAVQSFMSKRPIIIGNSIPSSQIDFHVNIGDVFLKTDVNREQVYLGVKGEAVCIGYSCNIGNYPEHQTYNLPIKDTTVSLPILLDVNGTIKAQSIDVDFMAITNGLVTNMVAPQIQSDFGVFTCNISASDIIFANELRGPTITSCNIYTSNITLLGELGVQSCNITGSQVSTIELLASTIFTDKITSLGNTSEINFDNNTLSNVENIYVNTDAYVKRSVYTSSIDTITGTSITFNNNGLSNIDTLFASGHVSIGSLTSSGNGTIGATLFTNSISASNGNIIQFSGATLSNINSLFVTSNLTIGQTLTVDTLVSSGGLIKFSGNSLSNILNIQATGSLRGSNVQTEAVTSLNGSINLTNNTLSNVRSIITPSLDIPSQCNAFNFNFRDLSNTRSILTSNIQVTSLRSPTGTFDFAAGDLCNIGVIVCRGQLSNQLGIFSTAAPGFNFTRKNASNIGTLTCINAVSESVVSSTFSSGTAGYFDMSRNGISNVTDLDVAGTITVGSIIAQSSVRAGNISTSTFITNGLTNVFNMSGFNISNVESLSLKSNLSVASINGTDPTISNVSFNNNTLCNVDALYLNTLTSTSNVINCDAKILSNIDAINVNTISTTNAGNTIDFDGKILSNISTLSVNVLSSANPYIDCDGRGISNIAFFRGSSTASTTELIDFSSNVLSNISQLICSRFDTDADDVGFDFSKKPIIVNDIKGSYDLINFNSNVLSNISTLVCSTFEVDNSGSMFDFSNKGLSNVSSLSTNTIQSPSGIVDLSRCSICNVRNIQTQSRSMTAVLGSNVEYTSNTFMKLFGISNILGTEYITVVPSYSSNENNLVIGVSTTIPYSNIETCNCRMIDITTMGIVTVSVINDTVAAMNLAIGDILKPSSKIGGCATKQSAIGTDMILVRSLETKTNISSQTPVKCYVSI